MKVDEIWQLALDMAKAWIRQPRVGFRRLEARPGSRQAAALAAERQNFTTRVEDIFRTFQRKVGAAVKDQGWDGNDDMDETRLQWSFAGALLYAVTVTTTIGNARTPLLRSLYRNCCTTNPLCVYSYLFYYGRPPASWPTAIIFYC